MYLYQIPVWSSLINEIKTQKYFETRCSYEAESCNKWWCPTIPHNPLLPGHISIPRYMYETSNYNPSAYSKTMPNLKL